MFNRSKAIAVARDIAATFVPLRTALRPIQKLLETAPRVPAHAGDDAGSQR